MIESEQQRLELRFYFLLEKAKENFISVSEGSELHFLFHELDDCYFELSKKAEREYPYLNKVY